LAENCSSGECGGQALWEKGETLKRALAIATVPPPPLEIASSS
jgi:hypothetical protein